MSIAVVSVSVSSASVSVSSASVSVSSASSVVSSALSMTSITGMAIGGVIASVLLILLLSSQEIISVSEYWNRRLAGIFNSITLPLLLVFSAIVVFEVLAVLQKG